MKKGDYVVATKYSDGDPGDHFCVGFFEGMTDHSKPRYNIVDGNGRLFRGNGFRRAMKISVELADLIVNNLDEIEMSGRSVWGWVKDFKKELNTNE